MEQENMMFYVITYERYSEVVVGIIDVCSQIINEYRGAWVKRILYFKSDAIPLVVSNFIRLR